MKNLGRMDVDKLVTPLISATELSQLIGHSQVKIFDVRGTWKTPVRALYDDYLVGHIPGAVFLDWTQEFLQQEVPLNLAAVSDRDAARQSFKNLGINKEDLVVVYDDYHHMFAGRIWWAMRYWGFDNVKVLNGGWRYWNAQQLPVSDELPVITEGSFQVMHRDDLRLSLDDFIQAREHEYVVDSRGAQNYAGKPDDPRTGHIPGAINVPFSAVLDETTGLFLQPDAIAAVFDAAIPLWRQTHVIASCGSGYAGTVTLLALSELGVSSSLFDGSFAEWKQDPLRAVDQC